MLLDVGNRRHQLIAGALVALGWLVSCGKAHDEATLAEGSSIDPITGGGDVGAGGLQPRSLCADSPILQGYQPLDGTRINIITQAELDALEGCEEIPYDLAIGVTRPPDYNVTALDLRPLHALRIVRGRMGVWNAASLEGLEQLEWVTQGLNLSRLRAPTLSPLASLTLVGSREDDPADGGIQVDFCGELEDLSGLDALEDFNAIRVVGNERLRSVWPLRPGANLSMLQLLGNSALADIGSFDTLENVRSLAIDDNGMLADLSALRGLRTADGIQIASNGSLAAVDFPELELTGDRPALIVTSNPNLERIDVPSLQNAERVVVRQNLKLNRLDLSGLMQAQYLVVGVNPELPASAIALHPDLSETTIVRIGGNGSEFETQPLDSMRPKILVLNPCPFAGDGYCDECSAKGDLTCQIGLCSSQSDGADCSAQ